MSTLAHFFYYFLFGLTVTPSDPSIQAHRARALKALGLLLADRIPTVGLSKTCWRKTGQTGKTKTAVTWKRKERVIWMGPTPKQRQRRGL